MKRTISFILVVDDSEDDCTLIQRAFRKTGMTDPIQFVGSGNEAVAYFAGEGAFADRTRFPYPSIVITDLKMAHGDGFHVLQHLKSHPDFAVIPVMVLSASADPDDIKRSYLLGASCYMVKPQTAPELQARLKRFYDFWMDCEVPDVDITGKQLHTESSGKLGARFAVNN
ncbi:MAG: response regulator receiver protein [Verrucomicrobiales bacterium]|nr:response regulator receiver protein [Verrucomicrobiales bacterium]